MGYILDLRKKVGKEPLIMVACGAIIDQDGKLLLQQRKDNLLFGFHGGSLEIGETLEETLIREVKEELGIIITKCHLFKTYTGKDFLFTYPNGDVVYIVDNIFIVDEYEGQIIKDEEEVLDLKWFEYDQVPWEKVVPHNRLILKEYLLNKKVK